MVKQSGSRLYRNSCSCRMYSLLFTLLMPIRFWMYRRVKWHYFMLDFCYFANLALLLFLWVFPSEPRLFLMVFADANGPLAWAIPAWRNALVFHDLDKMTSLYIHIFPMIVTYILRWNRHDLSFYWDRWAVCICPENSTQEDAVRVPSYLQWNATPELENATVPWLGTFNQNNYCGGSAFSPEDCALDPAFTFTWIVAFPVIGYLFWQFLYYVIVQCCRRKKIERDGGYLTSYIHLSKSKKHPVGKILRRFGKKTRVFMFGVLQLVYTIATFMLCSLFYHYHAAHIAFIAFVVASSAWNGASFYVVVFPKKMMDHKGKDKEVQQNSSSEDASGGKKNKIVPCSEGKK
mmetsp:Transcript_19835/g.50711  ORF Transcript_19835/g.50711 Transcript_19835/m.50711 type:complete len:347 (-) Transcript_19835:291-1331(-)